MVKRTRQMSVSEDVDSYLAQQGNASAYVEALIRMDMQKQQPSSLKEEFAAKRREWEQKEARLCSKCGYYYTKMLPFCPSCDREELKLDGWHWHVGENVWVKK